MTKVVYIDIVILVVNARTNVQAAKRFAVPSAMPSEFPADVSKVPATIRQIHMRFLLRLKHWQLFLITWGIPIGINLLPSSKPAVAVKLFPVMMVVLIVGIFGWIWAISTQLHKKLPVEVNLNVKGFKLVFSIPILYTLSLTLWMIYQFYFRFPEGSSNIGSIIVIIGIVHFVSMVCILVGLRFAAQTLRSVELGRLAKFSDYATEFFLIWFSPIGFWILQPRLNKLIEKG